MPLLMGSATAGHGVTRLLKALRHEAPGVAQTPRAARRRGRRARRSPRCCAPSTPPTAANCRWRACCAAPSPTARRWSARAASEERIAGDRAADRRGLRQAAPRRGGRHRRLRAARKLRRPATASATTRSRPRPAAIAAAAAADPGVRDSSSRTARTRCRLAAALAKLCEEDPSLAYVQDQESGELKLFGQGEMHLRVIVERLADRFGVAVETNEALGRLSRDDPRRR